MDLKNSEFHSDNLRQQPEIDRQLEPDLFIPPSIDRAQQKLPIGRMALPLLFQSLLICSIPFQSVYALFTGTTVMLKTQPVDPFDILRGYYQTLSYDISSFETLRKLPGWKTVTNASNRVSISNRTEYENLEFKRTWHSVIKGNIQYGIEYEKLNVQYQHEETYTDLGRIDRNKQVYITLIKSKVENANEPQAWQPVAISKELPNNLSDDRIAIRGISTGDNIIYGLETYYMPESRKDSVNEDVASTASPVGSRSQSTPQRRNLLVEVKIDRRGLATPVSLWVGKKEYHF